jgi:hypothetical protein
VPEGSINAFLSTHYQNGQGTVRDVSRLPRRVLSGRQQAIGAPSGECSRLATRSDSAVRSARPVAGRSWSCCTDSVSRQARLASLDAVEVGCPAARRHRTAARTLRFGASGLRVKHRAAAPSRRRGAGRSRRGHFSRLPDLRTSPRRHGADRGSRSTTFPICLPYSNGISPEPGGLVQQRAVLRSATVTRPPREAQAAGADQDYRKLCEHSI